MICYINLYLEGEKVENEVNTKELIQIYSIIQKRLISNQKKVIH